MEIINKDTLGSQLSDSTQKTLRSVFGEKTVYNFWGRVFTGANRKTILFAADEQGQPIIDTSRDINPRSRFNSAKWVSDVATRAYDVRFKETAVNSLMFEFAATVDFTIAQNNTMLANKSNTYKVFTESISRELETISITAYIRKDQIDALEQFMTPGYWCFIQHYKEAGGARKSITTNNFKAKKYQMVSLGIADEEYANCLRVNCEFKEVFLYDTIKSNIYTSTKSSNIKTDNKGKLDANLDATKGEEVTPWSYSIKSSFKEILFGKKAGLDG